MPKFLRNPVANPWYCPILSPEKNVNSPWVSPLLPFLIALSPELFLAESSPENRMPFLLYLVPELFGLLHCGSFLLGLRGFFFLRGLRVLGCLVIFACLVCGFFGVCSGRRFCRLLYAILLLRGFLCGIFRWLYRRLLFSLFSFLVHFIHSVFGLETM